jgi:hypothetical protein
VLELAMTASRCHDEPTIVVKHSQYLVDLHPFSPSGAVPERLVPYDARCCRYWWTNAIAMLPSPTAEATRFTGLNLTSPQANTPGTLVSSR